MISVTKHRQEIFKDIIKYVKSMDEPVDLIIRGDHNHEISSIEVQHFFTELQLQDVHQIFNGLYLKELDHTHSRGTRCIECRYPKHKKHLEGSRFLKKMK